MGFKAWYDNRADDLTKEVRVSMGTRLRMARLAAATDAGGG